eukprot:TRINITY_DN56250_c0_g1_i1.p1 TRINITY_DN56250_c0_g1~~TRINITY_DN56250_c0_g1_i1.p1  ORF type:complete len:512 (+),score=138.94 TRINITY_DN56250_c0_g1_i1:61-1596(+)
MAMQQPLVGSGTKKRTTVSFLGDDGKEKRKANRMTTRMSIADVKENDIDTDSAVTSSLAKVMVAAEVDDGGLVRLLHRKSTTLAEALVGEGNPDTDDCRENQDLQTNGEAMVNLLNNCLGSGLLGISFAFSEAGLAVALGIMFFAILLNRYTLLLNLKTCQLAQVDPSTTDVGERAFGKPGKMLMVAMFTGLGFFCCVSYISATADCLLGLAALGLDEDQIPSKVTISMGAWAVLLLPTTLMRSMKSVAVLSFVAFAGGLVMTAALVVCCATILLDNGLAKTMSNIQWFPEDASKLMSAGPLLCLCFAIQAGGGVVLATMKDTSERNVRKVTNSAYVVVMIMDLTIGTIAYLAFGSATKGDVIENLPSTAVTSAIARVCLLDLVVLSYMIMMIPCKVSLLDLIFGKNEALQEPSWCQFYIITLVLNVLSLGLAVAVPDLSVINGMNGSICTNFNAFIMPALFFVKIRSDPSDPCVEAVPVWSCRNIPYFLIALFGTVQLVLGSYQVAQSMR